MFDALADIQYAGLIQSVLLWIAVASTFIIIIIIISENRNPVKSLAWVTVLLLLPVVGMVIYLVFGRNITQKRMISRANRRRLKRREKRYPTNLRDSGLRPQSIQQIFLGHSLTGAQFYPGNSIMLFSTGQDKFRQLKADLMAATHSINIQYYIFSDDRAGREIAAILEEKAAAGVEVRLIYDDLGSFGTKRKIFDHMRKAGVQVTPFFKVKFLSINTRINWRNHRKVVVIDDKIGYVGGMNIADRYERDFFKNKAWRDTHLRIMGPAVAALRYSFAVDWNFTGGELIDHEPVDTDITFQKYYPELHDVGVQIISGGPTSQWSNIAMVFHKAIANAGRRVYIQTPYFLPTDALLRALQSAALARIDVRIMIPARSDSVALNYASASYIAECLRAGIKIYMYQPGMLHAKMLIVDDEFVSIGSTNFDFRSFEFNFEENAFLYSKEFNEAATRMYLNDEKQCIRINSTDWRKRPFKNKMAESVIRLLSPIL